MVEAIKTIKTEDGFALIQFGECPQLVIFSIGPIHTFAYDALCNNVELYHKQHEGYRNSETQFSTIIQTIQEAIDQYCYPIKFGDLSSECMKCIYDAVYCAIESR